MAALGLSRKLHAMIVVMRPGCFSTVIDHVVSEIRRHGLSPNTIVGTDRTVIAAVGKEKEGLQASLETLEGVEKVLAILAPYKMASKEGHPDPTVIRVKNFVSGGGHIGVIAGPCSVEGKQEILDVAQEIKDIGATGLRGGAFKPRTSPYSFQGLKEKGLEYLAEAGKTTGLAVFTEVMAPEHVAMVSHYSDVLQIGARNMQNYPLLEAAGAQPKPVLLKRGPSATMEEFLLAAEYILKMGNPNVLLCERGIRTFEEHTRFTLPLASVPYLQEKTHLPVVVDPSHGTGKSSLVKSMSLASIAAGSDALILEVHPNPEKALSDGYQTISTTAFRQLLKEAKTLATALGKTIG